MRKVSKKQREKNIQKKEETEKMYSFFLSIWKKRKHYSEISGKWLGDEALSTFFHHILPKSSYPDAKYDEENIILLTPLEHNQVESKPDYYSVINDKRKILKEKYV